MTRRRTDQGLKVRISFRLKTIVDEGSRPERKRLAQEIADDVSALYETLKELKKQHAPSSRRV